MSTLNYLIQAKSDLEDNVAELRRLCRVALHALETPGDFSREELSQLMDDLKIAGYPNSDDEDESEVES